MILGKKNLSTYKKLHELKSEHQKFIKTLDFNDLEILEKLKILLKISMKKSREEALWFFLYHPVLNKKTNLKFEKRFIHRKNHWT